MEVVKEIKYKRPGKIYKYKGEYNSGKRILDEDCEVLNIKDFVEKHSNFKNVPMGFGADDGVDADYEDIDIDSMDKAELQELHANIKDRLEELEIEEKNFQLNTTKNQKNDVKIENEKKEISNSEK